MKKFMQVSVALLIMPLFVISGIICCCFAPNAQAKEISQSCHSQSFAQDHSSSPQHDSSNEEDCDCGSIVLAPKSFYFHGITGGGDDIFRIIPEQMHFRSVRPSKSTAYQGPPDPDFHNIPLYLQYSNFQL